jgi:hypothetical protein
MTRCDQAREDTASSIIGAHRELPTAYVSYLHVDDSNGELGDCLHTAVDGLRQSAGLLSPSGRGRLFTYCLETAPEKPYVDWDWGWDLARLAADLTLTPTQRQQLFATLDKMVASREDDSWYANFTRERAALIKLGVIRRQDKAEQQQTFLEQHVQYPELRKALAHFHLERGELDRTRQVCNDWLASSTVEQPAGLRKDFMAILFNVAVASRDQGEQVRLAEGLFFATGNLDDFNRLKSLISDDQWPTFRSYLLRHLPNNRRTRIDLGPIYVAEAMWSDLLAYVQTNPKRVGKYANDLAPLFPAELSTIYETLAWKTLENEVNRNGYRRACSYLRAMESLGERKRVKQLIFEWRAKYKQRRALLDELTKAFGP